MHETNRQLSFCRQPPGTAGSHSHRCGAAGVVPIGLTAAGLVLVAVLGGCQDPVKAPFGGQVDLVPASDYPQIAVEAGLHGSLRFDRPIVEGPAVDGSVVTGPMHVTVPVRSTHDDYGLNVQYQFTFFDQKMQPLPQTGWRFVHLPPRMQRSLVANSLDAKAAHFRLEVRSSR